MNRYIILYKAPMSVRLRLAQATPEEAQQGVRQWINWQTRVGDALVDPGRPVGQAVRLTAIGSGESNSNVVGMSILQAEDMTHALSMVTDHHHLSWAEGCEIDVLEEMPIPELEHSEQVGPTSDSERSLR